MFVIPNQMRHFFGHQVVCAIFDVGLNRNSCLCNNVKRFVGLDDNANADIPR